MATTSRAPVNEEEFLGALYKGGELLAAGKIVEARSQLEKAHSLSPKNEKAQNLLGLTYFKLGLFDRASDIYEKLVNENPADPTLRVNLGLVYLKTNNLPRCIKEFETATDLDPEHKKAHNYLGLALAQAGDYAKAKEHFLLAGSEQMAEKMGRAISAKAEQAAPPPPPPPKAVEPPRPPPSPPRPPSPPPLPRDRVIAQALSAPLPPAPEEEIEVMSDSDVMDPESTSGEQPLPPPPPEPLPAEVEIAPPPSSGPRLDRDWGAQFGMDEAPPQPPSETATEVAESVEAVEPVEELPMIEAAVAAPSSPSAKRWRSPLVNSWDAAAGMSPPSHRSNAAADAPDPLAVPPPMPGLTVTEGDPTASHHDDAAWAAARAASWDAPPSTSSTEPAPEAMVEAAPDLLAEPPSDTSVTEEPQPPAPPQEDMSWNVPPDPARELDFGDVAPTDAPATAAPTWTDTAPEAELSTPTDAGVSEPPEESNERWSEPASTGDVSEPAPSWTEPAPTGDVSEPAPSWTEPAPTGDVSEPAASWSEAAPTGDVTETAPSWSEPAPVAEIGEPVEIEQAASPPAEPEAQSTFSGEETYVPTLGAAQAEYEQQLQYAQTELPAEPAAYAESTEYVASAEAAPVEYQSEPPADAGYEAYDPNATYVPTQQAQAADPSWVAHPLSQFDPAMPAPPPSSPAGYAPMQGRSLVELGAETSGEFDQPQGPFLVGPHGLAVSVNGLMLSRMTNLVAIVGSVAAEPETKRTRGRSTDAPFGQGANQMQRLSGHGVVHLEMSGERFHAVDLAEDTAYVREERLFAFEESIGFEHGKLADETGKISLELVHLSGSGRVLLALNGAMKSLAVPPGAPMVVPLQRLVGWFGHITPRLTGFAGQGAVELTGDGHALLVTPG